MGKKAKWKSGKSLFLEGEQMLSLRFAGVTHVLTCGVLVSPVFSNHVAFSDGFQSFHSYND